MNNFEILQKIKAMPTNKIVSLFEKHGKDITKPSDKDYDVRIFKHGLFTLTIWKNYIELNCLGLGTTKKIF